MSIPPGTFRDVGKALNDAAVELEKARVLLKNSDYWEQTSEYLGIVNMIRKSKAMAMSFNHPLDGFDK